MTHRPRNWLGLTLVLLVSVGASAQFQPGDVLFAPGAHGYFGRIAPDGRYSVSKDTGLLAVAAMTPAPDNRGLWVAGAGKYNAEGIYHLAWDGTVSTIVSAPVRSVQVIDLDDDGGMLAFFPGVGVVAIHPGPAVTTVHPLPASSYCHGIGLDGDTGDLIACTAAGVLRMSGRGWSSVTTILAGHAGVYGVLPFDPPSGDLVGRSGASAFRLQIGAAPATTLVHRFMNKMQMHCLIRDPRTGHAIASFHKWIISSTYDKVELYDVDLVARTATYRKTLGTALGAAHAVALAGGRHLAPRAAPVPGTTYPILVSFPLEPGAAYVVALSLALRPGFSVPGGRVVHLRPDGLFRLSLVNPAVFRGFQGRLDAKGEAVARIAIPASAQLSGLRFFVAAVTLDASGIRSIASPFGATLR